MVRFRRRTRRRVYGGRRHIVADQRIDPLPPVADHRWLMPLYHHDIFPVIDGVVADRVNRRGLLIAALMGSALLSGILAVPISLAIAGGICLFVSLLLILLFPRFRGTG